MERCKGIVVSNIPRTLTEGHLREHFKVKSNGGGPVDFVIFKHRQGRALITFTEQQVATNVITYTHVLAGSQLVVKPMPPEVFADKQIDLDIHPYWTELVGYEDMQTFLDTASFKSHIIAKRNNSYALRGNLYDLYESFYFLKEFLTMAYLASPCMYKETEPEPEASEELSHDESKRFFSGGPREFQSKWDDVLDNNPYTENELDRGPFKSNRSFRGNHGTNFYPYHTKSSEGFSGMYQGIFNSKQPRQDRATPDNDQTEVMEIQEDTIGNGQEQPKTNSRETHREQYHNQHRQASETYAHSQYEITVTSENTLLVHDQLYQFVMRFFPEDLMKAMSKNHASIYPGTKSADGLLELVFEIDERKTDSKDEFLKQAVYAFCEFYSQYETQVSYEEIELPERFNDADKIKQILSTVQNSVPVFAYSYPRNRNRISLFGITIHIPEVKCYIRKSLYDSSYYDIEAAGGGLAATTEVFSQDPTEHGNQRTRGMNGMQGAEKTRNEMPHLKKDIFISSNDAVENPVLLVAKDRLKFKTRTGIQVDIYQADITKQTTKVIVNAANERLDHAAGIAKAIANAAGPRLTDYCKRYIKKKKVPTATMR